MTEPTTVPPAEEAVAAASVTALPTQDYIDPAYFVPQATRDNYLGIIRDQSQVRGEDPDKVRGELVEQFRTLHERQPLDGYDHLAGWLAAADLSTLSGPTGMQVLVARTLESARRDPQQAVQGDQALVEQGVLMQQRADEDAAAVALSPSVDTSSGFLPNSGPLPVPSTATAVDPAVAEQQQAAQQQTDAQGQPSDQSATPPPPPAETSTSDSSSKSSKSHSSGSSS